ncbi:MAG TPA: hypothetical protein VFZ65_01300 [Planctomycetota bacterium]|nr:hypothetical protein [Planctomycetota bacterium]
MRPARGPVAGPALLVLVPFVLLGGCLHVRVSRASLDDPIAPAVLETLRPGRDDLGACLRALGAPHRVFEYRLAASGDGMALLWVWRDTFGWGFQVSLPSKDLPADFDFDSVTADLPGCVLWFGPDLVLERWRSGLIGELLPDRVRPSVPD